MFEYIFCMIGLMNSLKFASILPSYIQLVRKSQKQKPATKLLPVKRPLIASKTIYISNFFRGRTPPSIFLPQASCLGLYLAP